MFVIKETETFANPSRSSSGIEQREWALFTQPRTLSVKSNSTWMTNKLNHSITRALIPSHLSTLYLVWGEVAFKSTSSLLIKNWPQCQPPSWKFEKIDRDDQLCLNEMSFAYFLTMWINIKYWQLNMAWSLPFRIHLCSMLINVLVW